MFLLRDICICRHKNVYLKKHAWGQENCCKNGVVKPKTYPLVFLNDQSTKIEIKTNFTRKKLGQYRILSVNQAINVFKPLNITKE